MVFALLSAHLLGLAEVDDLCQTLDLGLSLGKILLNLPALEAEDVTLTEEAIELLVLGSELPTQILY